MKRFSSLAAGVIALGFASSPALALSSRTFVSGVGSDAGVCPVTTPCRTFAYALTQTAPSGEIIVLSSAGYGAVTINQAVSIINTSNFAGVTVVSGNGITINEGRTIPSRLREVLLHRWRWHRTRTASFSIPAAKLTIDQCEVMNFVGGSSHRKRYPHSCRHSGNNHNIVITNTTASNNQNMGVSFLPPPNSTAVTGIVIDRVSANNNLYGIAINNLNSRQPCYGRHLKQHRQLLLHIFGIVSSIRSRLLLTPPT